MATKTELIRLLEASGLEYHCLESGRAWLLAAPALGARMLGAGLGEENAFWTNPRLSARGWSEGGNAGGQRSWLAPESGPGGLFFTADGTWSVPPLLDPGSYKAITGERGALGYRNDFGAQSADGRGFELSLTRRMRIAEVDDAPPCLRIDFVHELANRGSAAIDSRVGLWSILQLPASAPGLVLFSTLSETRGASPFRPYFVALPKEAAGAAGRLAWLRVAGGSRYKVGLPARDAGGAVAMIRRATLPLDRTRPWLLTALSFPVDPLGLYLDKPSHTGPGSEGNGDAAQAYNDPGTGELAFCEIEAHSPAPRLESGQSLAAGLSILVACLGTEELDGFLAKRLGMEGIPLGLLPA